MTGSKNVTKSTSTHHQEPQGASTTQTQLATSTAVDTTGTLTATTPAILPLDHPDCFCQSLVVTFTANSLLFVKDTTVTVRLY